MHSETNTILEGKVSLHGGPGLAPGHLFELIRWH